MNLIKIARKPYLSLFMAFAVLFAGAIKVLATVALIEACGDGWGDI